MPGFEIAAPPSAYAVVLKKDTYEYVVDIDAHGYTITGKDGAEKILRLFMNEEFNGEYLEPSWKKGWTNTIDADQPFVALVDSGLLKLKGEADVAGTYGYGWIKDIGIVPMMDETEVTVELEVPINDVAAGANRAIYHRTFLSAVKDVTERPSLNDNTLFIEIHVTDNGLLMTVAKSIDDADTDLFTGSTYDDASIRSETAEKFTIWRIVFHEGHAGAAAPSDDRHMHIYLKQGVDRATAEAATENQLTTSPYDISDVLFDVGYPAYQISTQNADYYDDGTEAVSTYFRATYPDFTYRFLTTGGDDYLDGACEIWDGDPDAGGFQVHDENHVFAGDPYIQNGLIRLQVDEGQLDGLNFSFYKGAWTEVSQEIGFELDGSGDQDYPFFKNIVEISTEQIIIKVRLQDDAADDDDEYVDIEITISRGSYVLKVDPIAVYPAQDFTINTRLDVNNRRFTYVGDEEINHEGLTAGAANTTMTDNLIIQFEDVGDGMLYLVSTNKKPASGNTRFLCDSNEFIQTDDGAYVDLSSVVYYLALIPFSLVANLFKEAEDATISANARSNLDGDGVDTVTENDGVWAATLNCAVDENNLVENSVGAACVDISSTAGGAVQSTCTPAAPLGKLTKFDDLKVYLHGDPDGGSVTIRLIDADGDSVTKAQAITGAATEYTIALPHSDTDLQGWAEVGTFVYTTFTTWRVEWTAAGGGEHVYVDGSRNYIGTTTTRGRGETLSGGDAVVLDAQDEYVEYVPVGGTDLPEGYYLAVVRAKDTDQVADDLEQHVYDEDDLEYRNQENQEEHHTLAATFGYKMVLFHISAEDVSDTDAIRIRVTKDTVTENTIFADYILIIPLGDGESGPMDLAHGALQAGTRKRRLPLR